MKTKLKTYVIAIAAVLMPNLSYGAVFCAPAGKSVEQLDYTELFHASSALNQRALKLTADEGSDTKTCVKDLSNRIRDLAKEFVNKAPQLSAAEGSLALNLLLLTDIRLLEVRVKTGVVAPDLKLAIRTQDYIRFIPTTEDRIPSVSGRTVGPSTILTIDGEGLFAAHLQGIGRVGVSAADQAKQYYEITRCLLARTFIAKSEAYAQLMGEFSTINLHGQKACGGLDLNKLLNAKVNVNSDYYFDEIRAHVNSTEVSEPAQKLLDAYEKSTKKNAALASIYERNSSPELMQIHNELIASENDAINKSPTSNDVVRIGLAMAGGIRNKVQRTKTGIQLPNLDVAYRRLVLATLRDKLSTSTVLRFTQEPSVAAINLTEILTSIIVQAFENAVTAELVLSGQIKFSDATPIVAIFKEDLTNSVRQALLTAGTAGILVKQFAPAKKRTVLNGPLIQYASELNRITDPVTDPKTLKYSAVAIASLFDGAIESMAPEFRVFVDQINSRQTHADRSAVWSRLKSYLPVHAAKNHYDCSKPGKGDVTYTVLRAIFRRDPTKKFTQEQSCYFATQFGEYLGLENSKEPKTLGDVWPAFEKYQPEKSDQKKLTDLYRQVLKSEYAQQNRILDYPLNKLGVKTDLRLYDAIAKAAQKIIPKEILMVEPPTVEAEKVVQNPAATEPVTPKKETKPISDDQIEAVLSATPLILEKNPSNDSIKDLSEKALRAIRAYDETEALKIVNSQTIEDLHPFIKNYSIVDEVLGAKAIDAHETNLLNPLGDADLALTFPGLLQFHNHYKDELNRKFQLKIDTRKQVIADLQLPIVWLGSAWVLRYITLATPGVRAVGATLKSLAAAGKTVTLGYSHFVTWTFALGFYDTYQRRESLQKTLDEIEAMKLGDAVLDDSDTRLIDYNHYMFLKNGISADLKSARNDMIRDGIITLLIPAANLLEPILATRAYGKSLAIDFTAAQKKNIFDSWSMFQKIRILGAKKDVISVRGIVKSLGAERLDLFSLQAAKARSISPAAEELYRNLIFTLGQRANLVLSNPETAKAVAKIFYGSESNVSELTRLASEYNRLFPDMIRGGL